jgi:rod shape-determining protein MreC
VCAGGTARPDSARSARPERSAARLLAYTRSVLLPRNRTVRLAVLGSSVQRAAARRYPAGKATAVKRRVVAGVLVVLSLLMITLYFRESESGGLHSLQDAGATALRPFQVAAERVARPFRDAFGWVEGVIGAKEENEQLRDEIAELRQAQIQANTALQENKRLKELLGFRDLPVYPDDFTPIFAAVVGHAPSQFEQEVVIAAGAADGIQVNDPVVNQNGLIGKVTAVTPGTAKVTLLSDAAMAVSAVDLASGAIGLVRSGGPSSASLILDRVDKRFVVTVGDEIVTAGSQRGALPSLYPRGIPIGKVTSVGQSDTDLYKRVQVDPYVDFGSLHSVVVIIPKRTPSVP